MTQPTARLPLPYFIVQGLDYTIDCPLWRDGRLVRVTGGSVSIYDRLGHLVVDSAQVDVTPDGVPTYTVPGATTSPLQRGEGWRVEWELEDDDGPMSRIVNEAALVRTELRPVISDADVARRVPNLDLHSDRAVADRTTWQSYIDEAWVHLQTRLLETGKRPHLVLSPASLREVHLLMTLALIYEDLSVTRADRYAEQAADRRRQAEAAWGKLRLLYDADDDGRADQTRSGPATVWLMGGW